LFVAALLAAASSAHAVPITFTVDGVSATTSGVTIGSTVTVTPSAELTPAPGMPLDYTFELDDTAGPVSKTFDFLDVTVTGIGAVAGYIDAALNFSSPVSQGASGVLGGFAVVLGIGSAGVLSVLNDPGPIAFDGGMFDVDFIGFSTACLNCTTLSGTVKAKVSVTSVPEPGTVSLLGAGLLALALSQRRRMLRPTV
jgi:hypothetical protein